MSEDFNDPQFKQAVKHAWSGEKAPRELRRRVAESCATESLAAPRTPWHWLAANSFGLAATAVLIFIGAAFLLNHAIPVRHPQAAALPVATAQPFVRTHDTCSRLNDHHFVPPDFAGQMATTGRWLSSQAHVPVLAVNLDDGWNYCGAGPCPVGGFVTGHLLFKRGKEDLSIFSVPAADFNLDGANRKYDADLEGHGLAAFTRDGGLYCVVGHDHSGFADIDSVVRNVRQSLIKDFTLDSYSAAGPTWRRPALAVLLRD